MCDPNRRWTEYYVIGTFGANVTLDGWLKTRQNIFS